MKLRLLRPIALFMTLPGRLVVARKPVKPVSQAKFRHFVAFAFKEATTPEQIDCVVKAFLELRKTIPEVQSIEVGPNKSLEHLGFSGKK